MNNGKVFISSTPIDIRRFYFLRSKQNLQQRQQKRSDSMMQLMGQLI